MCVFEINVGYMSMNDAVNSPKHLISKTFIFTEFTMAVMRNQLCTGYSAITLHGHRMETKAKNFQTSLYSCVIRLNH
jgi:hypothetical protein